jgi:hypothetical protein
MQKQEEFVVCSTVYRLVCNPKHWFRRPHNVILANRKWTREKSISLCLLCCRCETGVASDGQRLIPWSRFILEELIATQLVKKFPILYDTEDSLPCSQEPATGPIPRPPHTQFLQDPFQDILSYAYIPQVVTSRHVFRLNLCMRFSSLRFVLSMGQFIWIACSLYKRTPN